MTYSRQHQKADAETDGVERAYPFSHKQEITLAIGAADLDPRTDCETAAHRRQQQIELRKVGHRRYGFLADVRCHHGVENRKDCRKSLVKGQGRSDVEHDFPHRRVQAHVQVALIPVVQFCFDCHICIPNQRVFRYSRGVMPYFFLKTSLK